MSGNAETTMQHAQEELARVLYPLFIHCYLELISKRATSEAHQLLTKQKHRFTTSGAQTAKIREQVCNHSHALALHVRIQLHADQALCQIVVSEQQAQDLTWL